MSNNEIQLRLDFAKKLVEEAGDVMCMIELMIEQGILTEEELNVRIKVKREKLKIWSSLINEQK